MRPTPVAHNAAGAGNTLNDAVAFLMGNQRRTQRPLQGQAIHAAHPHMVRQAFIYRAGVVDVRAPIIHMNQYGERLAPTNIWPFSGVVEGSFADRHDVGLRIAQGVSNMVLSMTTACLTLKAFQSDAPYDLLYSAAASLAACAVNTAAMTLVNRYALGGRFDAGVPVTDEESSIGTQPEASVVHENSLTRMSNAPADLEAQVP